MPTKQQRKKRTKGRVLWITDKYGLPIIFYSLRDAKDNGWTRSQLIKVREEQ